MKNENVSTYPLSAVAYIFSFHRLTVGVPQRKVDKHAYRLTVVLSLEKNGLNPKIRSVKPFMFFDLVPGRTMDHHCGDVPIFFITTISATDIGHNDEYNYKNHWRTRHI